RRERQIHNNQQEGDKERRFGCQPGRFHPATWHSQNRGCLRLVRPDCPRIGLALFNAHVGLSRLLIHSPLHSIVCHSHLPPEWLSIQICPSRTRDWGRTTHCFSRVADDPTPPISVHTPPPRPLPSHQESVMVREPQFQRWLAG